MRTKHEIRTAFAPSERLKDKDRFFLVGIGGAGMSALARLLLDRGKQVGGSDLIASDVTNTLEALGAQIWLGQNGVGIQPGDAVVLSDAIDLATNRDVERAVSLGCDLFRRSQLLGTFLEPYKLVAVTGTHGKTTMTAMIGAALVAGGLDPLVVVGAEVPQFGGSIVEGQGMIAVAEACEAYESYLDLHPDVAVLTNLELDHVDFHGSLEGLQASLNEFLGRIREGGTLVYCEDDAGASLVAQSFKGNKVGYGLGVLPDGLRLPGRHNRVNAAGALAASKLVGASEEVALAAIRAFGGAERRLQVLQEGDPVVIDDYAHHPSEIAASIQAIRERYPGRRLVTVFQPHLYSRTAAFLNQFAEALSASDLLVLTDIYPAREAPKAGISSGRIAELATCDTRLVPSRRLLPRKVKRWLLPGDVVVGMGAGSIDQFAPALIQELHRSGPMKVAVVFGGDSAEREVSLHSGRAVLASLQRSGYAAFLVDVSDLILGTSRLDQFVGPDRPDVAFLAVHGSNAEDGATQGLFELLHIPYTGSNIQASAIAMDKELTKRLLEQAGLPVPRGVMLTQVPTELPMHAPLIVKPNAQGSTVGLSFVEHDEGVLPAIQKALRYDSSVLVEEWVRGMEISVPVLGDLVLPPVEIAPLSGRYDFGSKYSPGATEEIVPARLPQDMIATVQVYALRAHRALRCRGATRTDMIVSESQAVILEVNTLPGMTATSLLPNSAAAAGISFDDLVRWIVNDALEAHGQKA